MPPKLGQTPHSPPDTDNGDTEGVTHISPPSAPIPSSGLTIACAAPASITGALAGLYQFRENSEVAWALRHFSSVRLERVQVTVIQATVTQPGAGPSTTSLSTCFLRYGVVPRTLPIPVESENSLSYVPHLVTAPWLPIETGATTHTWGDGGSSFPPGLELDFAVIENRYPYIAFIVGSTSKLSIHVQLDFLISCSGVRFGAPA